MTTTAQQQLLAKAVQTLTMHLQDEKADYEPDEFRYKQATTWIAQLQNPTIEIVSNIIGSIRQYDGSWDCNEEVAGAFEYAYQLLGE